MRKEGGVILPSVMSIYVVLPGAPSTAAGPQNRGPSLIIQSLLVLEELRASHHSQHLAAFTAPELPRPVRSADA